MDILQDTPGGFCAICGCPFASSKLNSGFLFVVGVFFLSINNCLMFFFAHLLVFVFRVDRQQASLAIDAGRCRVCLADNLDSSDEKCKTTRDVACVCFQISSSLFCQSPPPLPPFLHTHHHHHQHSDPLPCAFTLRFFLSLDSYILVYLFFFFKD